MTTPPIHVPPDRPDGADEVQNLLSTAARVLVKSPDPKPFLDWIAEAGPSIAPGLAARVVPETGPAQLFFRSTGVAIYNAMPLPDWGYRPRPLREPGRNEVCSCGSGRKYKHCCLPLKGGLDLGQLNLLRYVLDHIGKVHFSKLPESGVDLHAVYDTAHQWTEEGELDRAAALLEPWFAPRRALTARLDPLLDQLMDTYRLLGKDRKRIRLLDEVISRGDSRLRAAALQRRATILADQGKAREAWAAFTEAQRESPDDPMLAPLEISLLVSRGDREQARERARFWAARLERFRDPDLAGVVGFMREVAADPSAAFSRMSGEQYPELDALARLLQAAPAIEVHYSIDNPEQEGLLQPDAAVAAVEEKWRGVFEQIKPELTTVAHGEESVWENAEQWLELLEREPLAWQSFEVLDDLAMAVDALPCMNPEPVMARLLDRGAAMLQAVVDACRVAGARLDWAWAENRPALRLLAHRAFRALDSGTPEGRRAFVESAERLIALNPRDNHGVRDELTRAYIEAGDPGRALALADRYPGDLCTVTLNRILALHRLGRLDEAVEALRAAGERHKVAIDMLLAEKPAKPRASGYGIAIGGKDEAWLYREAHRSLWEMGGALEWLRAAWRKK
jgi:tetratricopeptide (TPR) repeat protein